MVQVEVVVEQVVKVEVVVAEKIILMPYQELIMLIQDLINSLLINLLIY